MRARKRPTGRGSDPRLPAARRAVAGLLRALGLDARLEPELRHTPDRVARLLIEALSGLPPAAEPELAAFPARPGEDGLVVVRDLSFHSLCVHHLVPFFGRAHVAYIPGARLPGISTAAKLLAYYSRRPQVQERIGRQIVEHLMRKGKARGAAVLLEARHLCMEMRGVRARGLVRTWAAAGMLARPARADALRAELSGRGRARPGRRRRSWSRRSSS